MKASPFKEDDLFHPADEGRDEAHIFYQHIMGMKTPIVMEDLPDINTVANVLSNLPSDAI